MIFAKLDVCFWRDKKFRRAGIAASGYWAGALTWLREDSTEDGVIPFDMVGEPLGAGEREGIKLADRLVEVGLFAKRETGYELLGYAAKNETKATIEARLAADRERKAAAKTKRVPSGFRSESEPIPNGIRVEASGNPLGFPGSDSGSGSGSASEGVQGGPLPAEVVPAFASPSSRRGWFGDERAWFTDAVIAASGNGLYVAPHAAKCGALGEVLRKAPGCDTHDAAKAWLVSSVAAYVRATDDRRGFHPLTPDAWARWVGDGSPSAERMSSSARASPGRAVPRQQTPPDAPWLPKD